VQFVTRSFLQLSKWKCSIIRTGYRYATVMHFTSVKTLLSLTQSNCQSYSRQWVVCFAKCHALEKRCWQCKCSSRCLQAPLKPPSNFCQLLTHTTTHFITEVNYHLLLGISGMQIWKSHMHTEYRHQGAPSQELYTFSVARHGASSRF